MYEKKIRKKGREIKRKIKMPLRNLMVQAIIM